MRRKLFREDHEQFRPSFRQFLEREVKPHQERWNEAGIVESGFAMPLHSDVVVPYLHEFGNEAQKKRWLPSAAHLRGHP